MAEWSEVFDDERVLTAVRRRARRTMVAFAVGSLVSVASAPLGALVWPHAATAAALVAGLLLTGLAAWTLRRLSRLHRTLWKVELSVGRIVGHDVGGRRVSITWSALSVLDVRSGGIAFVGRDHDGHRARLVVPSSMPGFVTLGHRAVGYAEAFGCSLWVEGAPWNQLDLAPLCPFVREDSAPTV